MRKVKKLYVENNIYYGWDSKKKNMMIYAFDPLHIVRAGDFYTVVKKCGRGNYRQYLVKNDLLKWEV